MGVCNNCMSTLKIFISAEAFKVPISYSSITPTNIIPFFNNGPSLFLNEILCVLSLYNSTDDTSGGLIPPEIDEFLELERTHLRSNDNEKIVTGLKVIEEALCRNSYNGSYFLVGERLTVVDIAIVVTL